MNHHAKPHMNSHSSPLRRLIATAGTAALLSLAACGESQATDLPVGPSPDGVDLRGSTLGGEFELTANSGEPMKWSDFDGKYRMVYFGFTSCPDICPTDVQRFSQGLMEFEKTHPELAEKIQPIFITIDPDRDTVEVVDEFVNAFHPRLIGMTGTNEEIEAVKATFGAAASKLPADETGWYNMSHTAMTYLYGPDGEPLGIIPTDKMAEGVSAELERWVR